MFVNQLYPFVSDAEYCENRSKAEKPEFNLKRLDKFPRQFEAYFRDHFSVRGYFLRVMGEINTSIWKKSPKPDQVIIGKDQWLYNVDKELDCYYGKRNYSKRQLEEVLDEFKYREQVLDSMGIEMHIVICPTKYSVYPEYLPSHLVNENSINSGVQLVEYFKENSDLDITYAKDILMPLKSSYKLFYKSDNHWNETAGYFVAREVLKKISINIPEIPLDSFCTDTIEHWRGNLANITGNPDAYAETVVKRHFCGDDAQPCDRFVHQALENVGFRTEFQDSYVSNNENLPDAVIIRDSYGHMLIPYIKNAFHYSTFIWDGWNYGFNLEIIEKEQPDVVIYMILESIIPNIHERALSERK